jgi:hypothetical protein
MKGKVFGIGLSRTGTRTLNTALNMLDIKSVHYPDPAGVGLGTMEHLASGLFKLPILEEYDGLTDIHTVPFYPQLDEEYPGSKFILTVRDIDKWLASTKKNLRGHDRQDRTIKGIGLIKPKYWLRAAVYGTVVWDESVFRRRFYTHHAAVYEYFKDRPDDLLVMNITAGNGWNSLCPFLDKEIPNVKFPNTVASRRYEKGEKREEMYRDRPVQRERE